MKAYGMQALMARGCHYADEDVYTKGWRYKRSNRAARRNRHKRVYKKIQRSFNQRQLREELAEC